MADGEKRLPESILNIIKKKFNVPGLQQYPKLDIKWRVLNGKRLLKKSSRHCFMLLLLYFILLKCWKEWDSPEIIISSNGPGMKREFKRMVESHSEKGWGVSFGSKESDKASNWGQYQAMDTVPSDDKSNKKVGRLGLDDTERMGKSSPAGNLEGGTMKRLLPVAHQI